MGIDAVVSVLLWVLAAAGVLLAFAGLVGAVKLLLRTFAGFRQNLGKPIDWPGLKSLQLWKFKLDFQKQTKLAEDQNSAIEGLGRGLKQLDEVVKLHGATFRAVMYYVSEVDALHSTRLSKVERYLPIPAAGEPGGEGGGKNGT